MSNSYLVYKRNKVLLEALMNPKFHKDKKNFILKEIGGMGGAHEESVMKALSNPDPKMQAINDFWGHMFLDFMGILDPTPASDLANAIWYFLEKDYINAFFSCVGAAVPYVLDGVKLFGRLAFNIAKGGRITGPVSEIAAKKFVENFPAVVSKIKIYNRDIINFLEKMSPKASSNALKFIDYIKSKVLAFSAWADNLLIKLPSPAELASGNYRATTDKLSRNIKDSFEEFFEETFKNTAEAFDPRTWARRYQEMATRPIKRPFTTGISFLIWNWLADPQKRFIEQKTQEALAQMKVFDSQVKETYGNRANSDDILLYSSAIQISYLFNFCNKDPEITGTVLASEPAFKFLWGGMGPSAFIQAGMEVGFFGEKDGLKIIEAYNKILNVQKDFLEKEKGEEPDKNFLQKIGIKVAELSQKAASAKMNALVEKAQMVKAYLPEIEQVKSISLQAQKKSR